MKLIQIERRKIQINATISDALKQMDLQDSKLLIVTKDSSFFSLISIGDIQRALINNYSLDTEINKILRSKIDVAYASEPIDSVKSRMLSGRSELMPIIDDNGELIDVVFWEDLFNEKKPFKSTINIPVVIMAGGKGTRLKPLTNVIPKPLIPIGDSTIIEEIMNRFVELGSNDFLLSVNYKAETIKHYFEQLRNTNYKISYFQENKPLGTAGSLYLIKDKISTTFFVTNCDIIINEDYSEILEYHKKYENELTIVSALKNYPIPYGIIETKENGELTKITEKPELNYQINSGMYILEPHLLKEIPEGTFFHITQLIESILNRNGKVGVFPVSEKSWIDIGDWAEYLKRIS